MKQRLNIKRFKELVEASIIVIPTTIRGYTGVNYEDVFNYEDEINYNNQDHENI